MDECLPGQEEEEEEDEKEKEAAARDEKTTTATMATGCVDCCGQRAVCTSCPAPQARIPGEFTRARYNCRNSHLIFEIFIQKFS